MRKFNLTLFISIIIISLFGILMIYSASSIWAEYKYGDSLKYVKNQGMFFIIGIFLMIAVSKINYKWYYKNSNKILLICFILLILVLIPGIGSVRNGSRSWFGFGSFGIQPSEFAKLGLIIFTSKYLTNNENSMKDIKKGVLPILGLTLLMFFIAIIPTILIIFLLVPLINKDGTTIGKKLTIGKELFVQPIDL